MPINPEDPEIIAGLTAMYNACRGSIHAHQPIEYIRKKFSKLYKPHAKQIITKKLRRIGFVWVHKGRNDTYGITKGGIDFLLDFLRKTENER